MVGISARNKAFACWGYRGRQCFFLCLATPKNTPISGVCQRTLANWNGSSENKKSAWLLALRTFANFFGSLYGAEGGTRQRGEKDSNQLAVLLDKLKEQGSYGDPVSGTLTRCARCLI